MAKHKSPFTVDYRKPIIIDSNDPRNKNGASLNKYKSRAGSKVITTTTGQPLTLEEYISLSWIGSFISPSPSYSSNKASGFSIALDSISNICVAGVCQNLDLGLDLSVSQYDNSGNIKWQRRISGPPSPGPNPYYSNGFYPNVWGKGIAIDSLDNIYVVGYFMTVSGGSNIILVKYNNSGVIQWQKSLSSTPISGNQKDYGNSIAIDSNDNVYIAGTTSPIGSYDTSSFFIAKYNSSGVIQWQKHLYDSSYSARIDFAEGVTIDSSDNIYVVGGCSISSDRGMLIAKYNTSGIIQWQKILNNDSYSSVANDTFTSVTTDLNGNVYATGYYGLGNNALIALVAKYNNSGVLQWKRSLSYSPSTLGSVRGLSIKSDKDGNVYITGSTSTQFGTSEVFIAKYDNAGVIKWKNEIETFPNFNFESGRSITVDESKYYYLTGNLIDQESSTFLFLAKLPNKGYDTGTYVDNFGNEIIYSNNYDINDSEDTHLTSQTTTLTSSDSSLTSQNSVLVESAGIGIYGKIAL